MEVTDGVYTVNLEWTEGEPLSVHVIEAEGATLLFGAGDEYTADQLVSIVDDHDVDVIIVEHGDVDHYEGVPRLRDALDVEIAVPEGDASFLEKAGIDVDYRLRANERYWGVETIPAPGHTPDNMAYLYRDVLVAGDTVVGSDSEFAADWQWTGALAVIRPEWNEDDQAMKASVPDLLDYEFDVVLVTHGSNVYEDGCTEVRQLVDQLKLN